MLRKLPASTQALVSDLKEDIIDSINHVGKMVANTEYGAPKVFVRKRLTQEQVDSIRYLAMQGTPVEEIALHVGISVSTIYRRYAKVFEEGRRKLRLAIRRAQFKRAIVDESDFMLTHLGKVYCDQSQPLDVNLHGELNGTIQHEHNFTGLSREQIVTEIRNTRQRILETDQALADSLANEAPHPEIDGSTGKPISGGSSAPAGDVDTGREAESS